MTTPRSWKDDLQLASDLLDDLHKWVHQGTDHELPFDSFQEAEHVISRIRELIGSAYMNRDLLDEDLAEGRGRIVGLHPIEEPE